MKKDENLNQIKFDNRTIEAIKPGELEFTKIAKDGSVKGIRRILYPFKVDKKTFLKGLKLCIQRDTHSKWFWLSIWFKGKNYYLSLGKFIPGVFGVQEVQDKLFGIYKANTNDKGHWVRHPGLEEKKALAKQERSIESQEYVEQQRKTINEVIIELMKANMPKIKADVHFALNLSVNNLDFL